MRRGVRKALFSLASALRGAFFPSFLFAGVRARSFKANYEGMPLRRHRRAATGTASAAAILPACARVIPTLLTARRLLVLRLAAAAGAALGAFAEIENVQDGHKVPSNRKCSTAQ